MFIIFFKKSFHILVLLFLMSKASVSYSQDTHEYVDLGLYSRTLWATCNIGAESPEDYGDYFAWGETEPKDSYRWETLKYCNDYYGSSVYKYTINDKKWTLEPSDDPAAVKWGGKWHVPTEREWQELVSDCKWIWITQGGHSGYKVIGRNNNFIFLPAAGCRDRKEILNEGEVGYYWSSSKTRDNENERAYHLFYTDYKQSVIRNYRYYGESIRPVRPKKEK